MRLVAPVLCVLVAFALPAAGAREQAEAAYLFALGKILVDEGAYEEAGNALRLAVEGAPDDPFLRVGHAEFLLDSGDVDAALRELEAAARLAPDDPLILKAIGHLQLQAARENGAVFDEARRVFEKLRELQPGDLDVMSTLGRIYLSAQQYAEAAEVFRQALSYWPRNRTLHGSLIDALLRVDGGAEAEPAILEFLDVAPDSIRARLTLADLRQRRGNAAGAAAVLRETPRRASGDAEILRQLAVSLYGFEMFPEALYWLDRSLAAVEEGEEPEAQLLVLRALLLTAVERHDEARAALEDLLAANPDRQDVLELLVRQLFSTARFQDVADLLEPRLEGDLDLGGAQLAMLYSEALRQLDRPEEALAWLPRVAEFEELRPRALARQAEALLNLGREAEADRALEELTASGETEALMLAAEACQREESYERSVRYLELAIAAADEPPQARFWLGAAYERTGRKEEAEGQFRRFLEAEPDSAPALNYLGYMWAEEGENLAEALELVERAVALDPDNGAYLDSLGWAHFQAGNYEEARVHLERAAELVGDDAVVFEHLGDLYATLGDNEQAVELYRRALDLDAENAYEVMTKLRRLETPRDPD